MNLFTNLPKTLPEELSTVLQQGQGISIERIVSKGPKAFGTNSPCTNGWSC